MKSGRTLKTLLTAIVVFASMINGMAQVPSYVPANGLVGYWPFNGNANDQSGNGNNGTVNGATLTADRNGNANAAYSFDGVNDWININNSNSLNPPSQITISAWVNTLAYNVSNASMVVNKGWDQGPGHYDLLVFSPNNKSRFVIGSNISVESNSIININQWTLITASIDSLTMKIYVNGTLENTVLQNNNNSFGTNTDPLYIGKHDYNNFPYYFNGKIDDIAIWNRALTQNEITQLYTGSPCVNYQVITVTDTLIINANLSGINPVTFQNTIKVYPNPSSSQITIDFGANFNTLAGYTMRIQNAVGQTVYTTGVTQQQFTSNLNTWTGSGIYFVYLIDAQGNTVDVKKIILQ
jgi:hypothetical protein